MKTYITCIYGGGTPLYLISAENEKRAWQLIREALDRPFNAKTDCNGLIEVQGWHADEECITNVHSLYSDNFSLKKGSYKDL